MSKIQDLQAELERANAEFEAAVEGDSPNAGAMLDRVDALEGLIAAELATPVSTGDAQSISASAIGLEPVVRQREVQLSDSSKGMTITKGAIGIKAFEPVLGLLSTDAISKLLVSVADTEDLLALVLPGTTVLDAEHRLHLEQRGDVKRAARGLAIAAAGGVDLDARLITSNAGTEYTIEDGVCLQLVRSEQPDFSGNVAVLEKRVPCKGHLEIGRDFTPTGGSHLRCKHQWALMFSLGYFVTVSAKVYALVVRTEIGQSVGDAEARAAALAQIAIWSGNAAVRQETRVAFAQAINAEKSAAGLAPSSLLPPRAEIGGYQLPSGMTVAQAITNLKGRLFSLKIEMPMRNNGTVVATTRVVKNLSELASAVAPHFAVARQNEGELKVLELVAR